MSSTASASNGLFAAETRRRCPTLLHCGAGRRWLNWHSTGSRKTRSPASRSCGSPPLEARNDAELANGRHAELTPALEALVRQHPLRERLRAQLMLALYRSGRQADALESYRRGSKALRDELGIEPGPELRELERGILNQDESLAIAPAPAEQLPRAPHRRRVAALGSVGVLAVVVLTVAVAYLALRDTAAARTEVPPNAVGLIDTTTNEVVGTVPVSIRPGPVVAAAGIVWVGNLGDRNLTRIDAETHAALGSIDLDRTPTSLAVGSGTVWVVHALTGEVSRVESRFGRDVTHSTVARGGRPAAGIAVGPGAVWAAYGDSSLVRVDPESLRATGSALTGAAPSAVATHGSAVWVANSGDATILRYDAETFEEGAVRTTTVGQLPVALAYGAGALWVANRGDDMVTRIDPNTNAATQIRVGREPAGLAVVGNAVWVANAGDGTVSRIDPASNDVVATVDVGNSPAGVAVTDGLVWVTVQAR